MSRYGMGQFGEVSGSQKWLHIRLTIEWFKTFMFLVAFQRGLARLG